MARDPLAVLWRLRDAAVAEASRELAAARTHERLLAQLLDEHRLQMQGEQSEASGELVATFAAWRPGAQQRIDHLQAALLNEEADVQRQQQFLVGRRTDAEAVDKAIQRRQAEAGLIRARQEQAIMDQAAADRRRVIIPTALSVDP